MGFPQLGSIEFLSLKGNPADLGEELEQITRPGIDGVVLRKLGKKPVPQLLRGIIDSSSPSNATAAEANLLALQGTLVTWTNEIDETKDNVAVIRVAPRTQPTLHLSAVGTTSGAVNPYLQEFDIAVLTTEV